MTLAELSGALKERGLITEEADLTAAAAAEASASPWYVQVVMGICAWFAGLLLLSFVIVGLYDVFLRHDNWIGILVFSVIACAGARLVYSISSENGTFASQFALAISVAGQVGIAVSLGNASNARGALWGMVVVELVLTLLMPNRLHRVITSFGAIVAWGLATYEVLFGELPGVVIWGSAPQNYTYQMSAISVVSWLVVWAPVAYAAYWLVRNEAEWMAAGQETLLRPVTHGVIAALSIAPLTSHPASLWMALGLGHTTDFREGSLGATALWPLLAMLLSLVSLALAFAIRSRSLMGLAIIFALVDISCFYYVLGTTLLVKSFIMVVFGAGLMAAARSLARESA